MDIREALYALETATRNIIGEPFFDGLIAQAAFRAGKALCAYGAGEHGPATRVCECWCAALALSLPDAPSAYPQPNAFRPLQSREPSLSSRVTALDHRC